MSVGQAQEDAQLLRSVITPLEDEIESLKGQLKLAKGQLAVMSQVSHLQSFRI